jgi:hypothetical protein
MQAAGSDAQVPVDCSRRLAADRHPPRVSALEPHSQPQLVEEGVGLLVVGRIEPQVCKTGYPKSGIDEDSDDRVVAAGLEVLPRRGLEQRVAR